jgi:hypothetical protein
MSRSVDDEQGKGCRQFQNVLHGVRHTFKVGETVIETWTYQRSRQSLPRVITIVDGAIKSIETKPR